jgi:ElaB/YqjD/DUF883 family membrane-anchored ribosome-binding protein
LPITEPISVILAALLLIASGKALGDRCSCEGVASRGTIKRSASSVYDQRGISSGEEDMSVTSQVTDRVHEAQDAIAKASANAAAKAASFAEDVSAKVDETVDKTDAALATAAQQSREIVEKTKTATEGFKATVEDTVREQPLTALLLAVAGGFVVGAMWKGRG